MATAPEKPKLLAIVGPTASGKSALALQVADLTPAEIIAADSRTVYKYMDIGTAKPTQAQRNKVPHWGLDLLELNERYSAARFQAYAQVKIEEIRSRKKLPIMVGGTGLYVDSVLYDFKFPAQKSQSTLESLSVDQLQKVIISNSYAMPVNFQNKRHLIRSIERSGVTGRRQALMPATLLIGLNLSDEQLKQNIAERTQRMFAEGILGETERLIRIYGREAVEQQAGIVYKICIQLIDGEIPEQTAVTLAQKAEWQYARRQRTWYKKNNDIVWFTDKQIAFLYIQSMLNT